MTARALLDLPVRLHGIQLGRSADLLLDRDELRAVGLDVVCGDDVHRFLPLAAAAVGADEVSLSSPLVLLEEDELAFYRKRTLSLDEIRGQPVRRKARDLGIVRDLVLNADLTPAAVVVEAGGVERTVPFESSLRFSPGSRSAA